MLREIRCDKFRVETIRFNSGLNVILGDEKATNSIGKSTMLMVIDFAFGGDDLIKHNTDLPRELGHHDYQFVFEFSDERLYFQRGTLSPSAVYVCNENFEVQRVIRVSEYAAILKQSYEIGLPDISFRALVGLHFRIWGRANLSVSRPLHAVPAQKASECVDNLLKTYDQYRGIRELAASLREKEAEKAALRAAKKHNIQPGLTRKQYTRVRADIQQLENDFDDLRKNFSTYAANLSELVDREVLDLKVRKDDLLRIRFDVKNKLNRIEGNLENNRSIRSKNFEDLLKYFPDVNLSRLENIETFHRGVTKILRNELTTSRDELEGQLEKIDIAIRQIDFEMAAALGSVQKPDAVIDRVYEVALSLQEARASAQGYERQEAVISAISDVREDLMAEKERVIRYVENIVNSDMREITTGVFGERRKSPTLTLRDDGYSFEVYDDTGTGSAYVGLVLFDLAVFFSTPVPAVVHDSILFKNIENESVAGLVRLYEACPKQSFVALDEIGKYGADTEKLLINRSAIRLSDSSVLYKAYWRHRA